MRIMFECENCGAPIDAKAGPAVVECVYCGRTMRIAPPRAPTRPSPTSHPPAPSSGSAAQSLVLLVVVAGVAISAIGLVSLGAMFFVDDRGENAPPASREPPPRTFRSFGIGRPVLLDLDSDGIDDAIGTGRDSLEQDCVVAISGADARVLWMVQIEQDPWDHRGTFVPEPATVVQAEADGTLLGIDARNGKRRWQAKLETHVLSACTMDGGFMALKTADQLWLRVTLTTGTTAPLSGPPPRCAPPPQVDHRGVLVDMRGWTRHTRLRPVVPGAGVVRYWWNLTRAEYLAETRRRSGTGTFTEIAVLDAELNVAWRAWAAAQPELAKPRLRHLQLYEGVLYVVYDVQPHGAVPRRIAAFDFATGRRKWDTALEGNSGSVDFVVARGDRVYVAHEAFEVLDADDGRHLGRAGRFRNEAL